ncbi:DUF2235 domain-containing protein [Beggiatoa alba]|nr:DUF2235 domain-containing protein [Beggiatoa alba]
MTQIGEKSAQATIEIEKREEKDKKKIKIRVSVFFDGTLNNRTNIEQRLLAAKEDALTREERKAASELKKKTSMDDQIKAKMLYKMHGASDPGDEISYEGYYTNVVIMEKYIDSQPAEDYQFNLSVYIEGAGTLDKAADKTAGFAFAVGETGIPAKVVKGLAAVVKKIRKNHTKKKDIIEEITLDIFGFSRGAAAARNFIHQALFAEDYTDIPQSSLKIQLKEVDYTVKKVKVCFVGLYDTVSTYGFWKTALDIGAPNTKTLKLDAIAHAKQVIQLAAADEHREYFSLTNIKSARGDSREIFLPGVHSDIGGGYRDNSSEKQVIYENYGYSREEGKQELKERLASGWYQDNEIFLEYESGYEDDEGDDASMIHVLKDNISNQYSRIPLHLMAGYARENKIGIDSEFERNESIPDALSNVKQKIDTYIAATPQSKAQHWHGNNEQWLRDLRHDYFHFSARYKTGHTPRYYRGKRARFTFEG